MKRKTRDNLVELTLEERQLCMTHNVIAPMLQNNSAGWIWWDNMCKKQQRASDFLWQGAFQSGF